MIDLSGLQTQKAMKKIKNKLIKAGQKIELQKQIIRELENKLRKRKKK